MSLTKLLLQQTEQIAYCLGASNYTWIHFQDGKKEMVSKSISVLETYLPGFIRVHKRVLVNPRSIKRVHQFPRKKGEGEVQLASGDVFPVSRRRWSYLEQHLRSYLTESTQGVIAQGSPPPAQTESPGSSTSTILLVTDDAGKANSSQQLIHQIGPTFGLQTIPPRSLLASLLASSSIPVYPMLILLDAQTLTLECMTLLRTLKATSSLRHIPVILFVCPRDQLVIEGYQGQANSVVAITNNVLVFEQHLERILHYWFQVVAIPG